MAKIDKREIKLKKPNKRKLKEILEADSPTSKFKKLDISMLKTKTKKKTIQKAESSNSQMNSPKKRKSFDNDEVSSDSAISNKKAKLSVAPADSDEETHEPTLQEINESLKPENIKNIDTGRQKKRAKHQQTVEVNKQSSKEREILRNIEYLNKWKSDRDSWKFEKLRQISIQNSLYDEANIDDDLWWLVTEYLSGAKGAARDCIIKKSQDIINDIDSRLTETNKKEMLSLRNYKRAREMLQLLQ
ncbi:uncharacterized protein C7orf50 homolog [Bradysia coprophila]|uniref:uncharacterized protein C7orf50 homolog n=1 Tax=Bradysia coprophila TaxID=38358 RepID=UPI00187DC009|nr:uncharacterized protein C7orf50 homolog [Bradysia coprophila]